MGNNPLAAQMKKEQQLYAKEIVTRVNKALQSPKVQQQADALTQSSSTRPPKQVMAVFDRVLSAEQKRIAKDYAGLRVTLKVSYVMRGPSWIASVTATVEYPLERRGGTTYTVQPGDTLWDIAERTYGSGYYWTEIERTNAAATTSKGNFIIAGVPLKLPAIDVVPGRSTQPVAIQKPKSAPTSRKRARPVATPIVELDLERAKSVKTTLKLPGMTVIITTSLKGSLKAQRPGTLPGSFNLRTYETEISNNAKPFQSSFKIKSFKLDSIAIGSSMVGGLWTAKFGLSRTGEATISIAPRPVSFKKSGIIFEGNVGMDIAIRMIPDVRVPDPVPVVDAVGDWLSENSRTLVGVGLLVGAGAIVVVTIGEDIVTLGAGIADDPLSFAAAGLMAQRAMVMIR